MKFRSVVFWSHLVAGVVVGLFIFLMSATGVLLTYERQIKALVHSSYSVTPPGDAQALPVDSILEKIQGLHPDEDHFFIQYINRQHSAVNVWAGRDNYLFDPYSGEVLRDGVGFTYGFFYVVTELHRWLAIGGDGNAIAKAITGWSNVIFAFLIVSGIWLWWPRFWRWPVLKAKLLLNPKIKIKRAKYFHWHQVFSAWALIPLVLIVVSGMVMSFPWASKVLYGLYGETVPVRGEQHHYPGQSSASPFMSQQDLYELALSHAQQHDAGDWYSIWVKPGESASDPIEYYIDRSLGHRPWLAYELALDAGNGKVLEYKPLSAYSRGDQAWDFMRYVHTGEVYGFVGQTIAGLASLAACFLVYTGLALAWRRLITPRLARRKA